MLYGFCTPSGGPKGHLLTADKGLAIRQGKLCYPVNFYHFYYGSTSAMEACECFTAGYQSLMLPNDPRRGNVVVEKSRHLFDELLIKEVCGWNYEKVIRARNMNPVLAIRALHRPETIHEFGGRALALLANLFADLKDNQAGAFFAESPLLELMALGLYGRSCPKVFYGVPAMAGIQFNQTPSGWFAMAQLIPSPQFLPSAA